MALSKATLKRKHNATKKDTKEHKVVRPKGVKCFRIKDRDAYLTEHHDKIVEVTKGRLNKMKDTKDTTANFKEAMVTKTGYFTQPNVKNYQRELSNHLFGKNKAVKKGRGAFFDSVEECDKWIQDYIELCIECEVVPTVSALATWLQCDRMTLFNHANNPNSPFHRSVRDIIDYCHACLETGASESKVNSVAYIFQAKNYFSMRDTTDIQVVASAQEQINTDDTLRALKEQVNRDNNNGEDVKQLEVREATYEEKQVGEAVEVLKDSQVI